MLLEIIQIVYFMFPAYAAIIAPVIVRKLNFLDYPIDAGLKLSGNPLLGKNKTFRGLFFGTISGIAVASLQGALYPIGFFQKISLFDYKDPLLIGFMLGFGALLGDLLKSFAKRRLGIAEGKNWVPMDQIDFVVGSLLFISPYYLPGATMAIMFLLVNFILHYLTVRLSYHYGLRKD